MGDIDEVANKLEEEIKILDGLSNLATGLGTEKDKAYNNVWNHSGKNFDHVSLAARYREDWISQKVIKILPQDMTREWRIFESDKATEADEEFNMDKVFRMAYQWARLYGTSFIVLDIKDGRTTDKPVNWAKLKPGCLKSLNVVDRTRIVATGAIDYAPMSITYGEPTMYQFVNQPTMIHKDRLIRFEGTELPIYEKMRNLWYSDSVLIPLLGLIDNFHTTASAASQMVQEANIDVITVEGLRNMLQNPKGTAATLQRFSDWKMIKSVFGASILDSTETFDQKNIQLGGVNELLWQYLRVVAASVSIPATRFLSNSPSGLDATGYSDMVNYIEVLRGLQKDIFEPRLKVMDTLLAANYGLSIEDFKYEWGNMFPESASDKEDRLGKTSERLVKMTEQGILSTQSALDEAINQGLVSSTAKVGIDPKSIKEGNDGKGKDL